MRTAPATPWRVRPLTEDEAAQIACWRYPPPYHIYDSAPPDPSSLTLAEIAAYYLEPAHDYFGVEDAMGHFLGFGCFGVEAQVPGYDYTQEDALDIGFGMRPERTGQGRGHLFLAAILAHAQTRQSALQRATVAAFNERSARTFRRSGFARVATFRSRTSQPLDFAVYTRRA